MDRHFPSIFIWLFEPGAYIPSMRNKSESFVFSMECWAKDMVLDNTKRIVKTVFRLVNLILVIFVKLDNQFKYCEKHKWEYK